MESQSEGFEKNVREVRSEFETFKNKSLELEKSNQDDVGVLNQELESERLKVSNLNAKVEKLQMEFQSSQDHVGPVTFNISSMSAGFSYSKLKNRRRIFLEVLRVAFGLFQNVILI